MLWIKSGIENPSKSEVIGRCGGDGKNRMITQNRQKSNAKKKECNFSFVVKLTKEYITNNLDARYTCECVINKTYLLSQNYPSDTICIFNS